MNKNIIFIQRYYRIWKLKNNLKIINSFNLLKPLDNFETFKELIMNQTLLAHVKDFICKLNYCFTTKTTITNKIFVTIFMIYNYPNNFLGDVKDRHFTDNILYDCCVNIINMIQQFDDFKYKDIMLFQDKLINFMIIFKEWKNMDKNRTIQNIIISYYNRMKHIENIQIETNNTQQNEIIIASLKEECNDLLGSIKMIDPSYNINYLVDNYEAIYKKIEFVMNQLFYSVKHNFQTVYYEHLVSEFKNKANINIIYNLIQETNERLLLICPDNIKEQVKNKLKSYKYINIMLENKWTNGMVSYIKFILDTLNLLSNNTMLNCINKVASMIGKDYVNILPLILIEINSIIDNSIQICLSKL